MLDVAGIVAIVISSNRKMDSSSERLTIKIGMLLLEDEWLL